MADDEEHKLAKTAVTTVQRWFTSTSMGVVFLPGDGRAFAVSAEEEPKLRIALQAGAFVVLRQANDRLAFHSIALVIAVVIAGFLEPEVDPRWRIAISVIAFALYTLHGLALVHEFSRLLRSLSELREHAARRLSGRKSIPREIVGPRAAPNPNYRLLGIIGFALMATMLIAESAANWLKALQPPPAVQDAAHWIFACSAGGVVALALYIFAEHALRGAADRAFKRRSQHPPADRSTVERQA
jgi:hypothetical protein